MTFEQQALLGRDTLGQLAVYNTAISASQFRTRVLTFCEQVGLQTHVCHWMRHCCHQRFWLHPAWPMQNFSGVSPIPALKLGELIPLFNGLWTTLLRLQRRVKCWGYPMMKHYTGSLLSMKIPVNQHSISSPILSPSLTVVPLGAAAAVFEHMIVGRRRLSCWKITGGWKAMNQRENSIGCWIWRVFGIFLNYLFSSCK